MRWVKPSMFGNEYELRSAGRCVARLTVSGFFHPAGHGEGIGGGWVVEPLERDSGKIVVRADKSFRDVGVFDMSLSDHAGILRTSEGHVLILNSDFWKGSAEFQSPTGEPLIRFRFHGLFRPSAEVEILGEGKCLRELPWILMLGWCLIVGYL
ncbi:MAG: hypothetical protein HW389_3755 [Bacteroidetes bacterium]|nr:hypothetical protein [Bacteroidota bacterium]